MNDIADLRILENDLFTIDHSCSCAVPGYVVVRLTGSATSLSELAPATAQALGELLARATRAIEEAVGADRVYCLSFAELDRRLHFHLFPRTPLAPRRVLARDGQQEPAHQRAPRVRVGAHRARGRRNRSGGGRVGRRRLRRPAGPARRQLTVAGSGARRAPVGSSDRRRAGFAYTGSAMQRFEAAAWPVSLKVVSTVATVVLVWA